MTTTGDPRDGVRAAWSSGDYTQLATRLAPAAEVLVHAARVEPGDRALDIAAGTGNAALAASTRGASVVASDITPRMLELGRARTRAAGLELEWVEADADDLPFEDGSFDVALSAFGLMFADPSAAVAEAARVLRPGGRLALAVWDPEGYMGRLAEATRPRWSPPPGVPDPLDWGSEGVAAARLRGLFTGVEVHRHQLPWQFASARAARAFLEQHSPLHVAAAASTPPEATTAAFAAVEAFHAERAGTDGRVHTEAAYLVVTATRP